MRQLPNIIVTGIPGSGKSTISEELEELINKEIKQIQNYENAKVKHLNLSNVIKEEMLYEEYDDELDASVYSEDLVNEKLKKLEIEKGGYIIDFHDVCFIEQNDIIDHIFLLTIKTNNLYERLEKRNYSKAKIKNNVECEIFQVIKEDILETFDNPDIFDELENNNLEQYEQNIQIIKKWILAYINNLGKTIRTST